ncbi:MAG: glycosyltransferase [Anaerolineales bacterium]|nr:glycosyltransferase [Anaerolineales bacterium]
MNNLLRSNRKPDFAIYLPSLNGGGAQRAMLNLAHGLCVCGCAVDLVLAEAKGPYLAEVGDSVRLIDLKASRVLTSMPALAQYLRHEKPTVLISVLGYASLVALWARRFVGSSVQIVINEQNTMSIDSSESEIRRERLVPHLAKRFYPWADHITGNSNGVADDLSLVIGLPREQIKVIYNPVVTPELQKKAQGSLNHPWFENNQIPVILAVGRLTQQKDFPTLIRSFAQVRQRQPARLLILGEGEDRLALEALVNEFNLKDDVDLPGFVENPYAYMRQASLFVLSSQWEGLPTVLIEALYCGTPVIATDCPSGPREILADGQYGALVPIGDVAALTKCIEAGLAGDTPSPTKESWYPYSQDIVANQYLNLLPHEHLLPA